MQVYIQIRYVKLSYRSRIEKAKAVFGLRFCHPYTLFLRFIIKKIKNKKKFREKSRKNPKITYSRHCNTISLNTIGIPMMMLTNDLLPKKKT